MSAADEAERAARIASEPPDLPENEESDEIRLAPPDPEDEHVRQRIADGLRSEQETRVNFRPVPVDDGAEPLRYSLRDLLILVTAASVVLVGFRIFRSDVYTLAVGLMVLTMQMLLALLKPHSSLLYLGWWILLVLYIVAILAQAVGR